MSQYKQITNLAGGLFVLTIVSGLILSSPLVSADNSATNTVRVTVPISCNLASTSNTAHTATIDAGTYRADIGESTITATCNDAGGFAIYAIGYSGDTHGNNTLINTTNENQSIASGTATSGATSNWAMKLTAVTGTYEPTIESAFQNYTTIPTVYTKVASHDSTTDQTTGAQLKSTYAAYIAPTQYAGTYEGKVKYTLVHPSTHTAPNSRPALLDTGENVNIKMKNLANNTSNATKNTADSKIKSIQTSTSLPANFEATDANTISLPTTEHPVYIYFDNTNDAGIMYVYSGEGIPGIPVLNPDSSYLFSNLRALSTAPAISSWDTSNVTSTSGMFNYAGYSANSFSLNLSSWDTSNVTDMSGMFVSAGYSATSFSFDLSSWDVSNVTNMGGMFQYAGYSATTFSLDVPDWNASNVTNMGGMFYYAGYNTTTFSLDISNLYAPNVTSMGGMFNYAGRDSNSFSLDISNLYAPNVTYMGGMFQYAGYSAATFFLDVSNWAISSVTSMQGMFSYAGYSATTVSLDVSSWNTSTVTDMSGIFAFVGYGASSLSIDVSNWDTSSVTSMADLFYYTGYSATTWSIGNLSSWNTSSTTNMSRMFNFAGYSAATFSLNLSGWNTSSVTNMDYMFDYAGYSAATFSLNLSGWNTSSVTSMTNMFSYAGYSATTWSVTIPRTNSNGTNNTASRMYGETTSTYVTSPYSRSFTLAQ